jgi:hypothetical protein
MSIFRALTCTEIELAYVILMFVHKLMYHEKCLHKKDLREVRVYHTFARFRLIVIITPMLKALKIIFKQKNDLNVI